jgi:D-alanyl-lipoteichoic acid acyltransferase DltB (MBOAT superfamily)
MTFISLEFAAFLAIFFALYWFVFQRSLKWQNVLILVGSYVFYGWWDWRFLTLIFLSSLVDFLVGRQMGKTTDERHRKYLLWLSLGVNIGVLGLFKYFHFFLDNFKLLISPVYDLEAFSTLDILLPVGISFYTLQTLSYTIDVYRRKIEPTDDAVSFFAFVSFFPQLVAGPIERATSLLPQFQRQRVFDPAKAADGCRQILWGLFKKMVVADNNGVHFAEMFNDYPNQDGSTLLLSMIVGVVQFYCDFSGYSDIAIGTGRLLGFDLMKNFDYPFFSRNISELWQKWHISLISWFRDYLSPLLKGHSKPKLARNIFIIFIITGFWHGANWTFLLWGFLQALIFMPLLFRKKRRKFRKPVAHGRVLPTWLELWQMGSTFMTFVLVAIFFYSPTVAEGFGFLGQVFSPSLFTIPQRPSFLVSFTLVLFAVEWVQRTREHGLDFTGRDLSITQRFGIYFALIFLIVMFGGVPSEFIYFQF